VLIGYPIGDPGFCPLLHNLRRMRTRLILISDNKERKGWLLARSEALAEAQRAMNDLASSGDIGGRIWVEFPAQPYPPLKPFKHATPWARSNRWTATKPLFRVCSHT
jgi:hypothetical protein